MTIAPKRGTTALLLAFLFWASACGPAADRAGEESSTAPAPESAEPSADGAGSDDPWTAPPGEASLVLNAAGAGTGAPTAPEAEPVPPRPRGGQMPYPGEVVLWIGDFESLDHSPAFRTNSGATAQVVEEDGGNRALSIQRPREGAVGAVLFDIGKGAAEEATGLAFSYRGNLPEVLFDATLKGTREDGETFFIDPNFRSDHRALRLDRDEWQTAYLPFKRYRVGPEAAGDVDEMGIFSFGATTGGEGFLVDDLALVRNEPDLIELAGHYTDTAPRPMSLFFTAQDLPAIRAKIDASPELTALYERYRAYVEPFLELETKPYTGWRMGEGKSTTYQGRALHSHVLGLAFVGMIEDDPRYLDKAVAVYLSASMQFTPEQLYNQYRNALNVGDAALPLMIAYDWLNERMAPADRLLVKNRIHEYAAWIHTFSPEEGWGWDEPARMSHNWNPVLHAPLGLASILLDRPGWGELATRKVDGYLKYSIDADGAPRESGHYLSLGSSAAYTYVQALRRAGGPDLLEPHLDRLEGIVDYFANALLPWGGGALEIVQGWAAPDKAGWFLELCNELESGPGYGVYLRLHGDKERFGGNGTWGVATHVMHKANAPFIILAWDPSITPVLPADAGLPLSQAFVSGQAFARTGWGPEDAMLHFKSDEVYGGWSHADDNSFGLIAFGDSILCDPGTSYYHARHHNAVLIDGKGQAWIQPGHDVGGAITRFEDHGDRVVLSGDATAAYAEFVTGKPHLDVEKVVRHLCFLRKPEPLLLVLDEIAMRDDTTHDYSVMLQYGYRGQPSEVIIDAEAATVFARTKGKGVKSMTRVLWPESGVEILERPDIGNTVSTVEMKQQAVEAVFLNLVAPVRPDGTFPAVTGGGDPETGFTVEVDYPEHPALRIHIRDGAFEVENPARVTNF